MARSQNGYPANDRSLTTTYRIGGTTWVARLRKGLTGELLALFSEWFDLAVERIDGGIRDDWSYAERPVRGSSTTLSNHASGTAVDLNATKHPLGKWLTFTLAKRTKIRAMLRRLDGAIRAGLDYRNRPDDMHFEIDTRDEAKLRKAIATLRAEIARLRSPEPVRPVSPIKPGTTIDLAAVQAAIDGYYTATRPNSPAVIQDIKQMQIALKHEGLYDGKVDGIPGPKTRRAVAMKQARIGKLGVDRAWFEGAKPGDYHPDADGIPGRESLSLLGFEVVSPPKSDEPVAPAPDPTPAPEPEPIPAPAPEPVPEVPVFVTVATFNGHRDTDPRDIPPYEDRLPAIRGLLAEVDADILCVQEFTPRMRGDQQGYLWYAKGNVGVGFRPGVFSMEHNGYRDLQTGDDDRWAVAVVLRHRETGREIKVVSTHLTNLEGPDGGDAWRLGQAGEVIGTINGIDVLAGDFNDSGPVYTYLARQGLHTLHARVADWPGRDRRTTHHYGPLRTGGPIDNILTRSSRKVRNPALWRTDSGAKYRHASDHHLLAVEVQI